MSAGASLEEARADAQFHMMLRAACEATLLFYSGRPWGPEDQQRWEALTGRKEVTTKVLCDVQREALAADPFTGGKEP